MVPCKPPTSPSERKKTTRAATMPRVKTFLIFLLLILLLASSSCKYFLWVLFVLFIVIFSLMHCVFLTGQAGRTRTGKEPAYLVAKVMSMFNHLHATDEQQKGIAGDYIRL
ncbi:hypothetical protein B296_00003859 [Ensete ventricosum]|uniref:Uncharacterized protein n=1 Tax=Ensete ventricosum TaxID=4639 RepID=A0A427B9V9_ENSVE|nr:hypothetical protein B296_00003859 [Ensete ventricosum]